MREIKFRAWLKEEKLMIYVTEINFWGEEISGYDKYDVFHEGYDFDHATLMQYTGLKDKNSNEIYEGDILGGYSVYIGHDLFETHLIGGVCYVGGVWDCGSYILGGFNEQIEIIGNIYEDPELINKE